MASNNTRRLYEGLSAMQSTYNLIKNVDQDGRFRLEFDCVHEDIFHGEVKAKSAGVGALLGMIFVAKMGRDAASLQEMLQNMQ